MENYGIFLRKMIEIVAKGDTFIINFQFSILNYLWGELLDKLEFEFPEKLWYNVEKACVLR